MSVDFDLSFSRGAVCFKFQASFPSTSPYVTTVGATRFLSGTSGDEAAVDNFGSGGGFSRSFAAPEYVHQQRICIRTYI